VGDITTKKALKSIQQELKQTKCDLVLHDGSPNVGSNWLKDAYTQSELCLQSLKISTEILKPKGTFVTKVFRSKDYTSLMWLFGQFFEKVEVTKPKASRNTSAEIYVICFGYKAPKEIDPKLFDANFVFEEVSEKKKVKIEYEKKKRHRDGYEDGNYLLYKSKPISKFIDSDNPVTTIAETQVRRNTSFNHFP
jgi:AdoMet-dependent rRNA methyltransferase SPB1